MCVQMARFMREKKVTSSNLYSTKTTQNRPKLLGTVSAGYILPISH